MDVDAEQRRLVGRDEAVGAILAAAPAPAPADAELPLVVDLDGTLIRSDLLAESVVRLLASRPWMLFVLPFWLLGSIAGFKRRVAQALARPLGAMPFDPVVLERVRTAKRDGRRVVLATASDALLAAALVAPLDLFDDVLASDGATNLKGAAKARALVERFGMHGFDYIGDARADLPVWQAARTAIVAGGSVRIAAAARGVNANLEILAGENSLLVGLLRSLRLHQWSKNLLLLVPLLAAHRFQAALLEQALLAFACFGLLASSIYLLNDLVDLPDDRLHPSKRFRALASGEFSIVGALLLLPCLLLAAGLLSTQLPTAFLFWAIGYIAVTSLYSLLLKRIVLVDVFALAALYTLRLFAGAAAVDVTVSFWLLAFSSFIFASLAVLKRYAELIQLRERGESRAAGRAYQVSDLEFLAPLGMAAAGLAVLVLALYLDSPEVRVLYHHPHWLWASCPLMFYWLARAWLIGHRGELDADPVVFALRDPTSWALLAMIAVVARLAF